MATRNAARSLHAAAHHPIPEQRLPGVLRTAWIKPAAVWQEKPPQELVPADTEQRATADQTVHNCFLPFLRRAERTLRPLRVDIFLRNPCVLLPMMFERVLSVFFMAILR